MKRLILVALFSFFTACSFAQGMYGFEAGIGRALAYKPFNTPAVTGYHLWRLGGTVYFGGSLCFQKYSFQDNLNPPASSIAFGDVISIRHKSSYLFFSPELDFGIGYRKYFHFHFQYGVGIYTGGHQATDKYEPQWVLPSGAPYGTDTTTFNTTFNLPTFMFRYGAGISERIPTHGYFSVILSQDFSIVPGSLSSKAPGLNTNYVSFTIGVMHKYPMTLIDED